MQQQDSSSIDQTYLDRVHLLEAVCNQPWGIELLRMVVKITGWSRPMMSQEDSARRDVWLTIRQYCPVEKLAQIEYEDLKQQQERVKAMMEVLAAQEDEPWIHHQE